MAAPVPMPLDPFQPEEAADTGDRGNQRRKVDDSLLLSRLRDAIEKGQGELRSGWHSQWAEL